MFQSDHTNPSIPCLAAGCATLFQALQEVVHIAGCAMLEKLPALQLEHDPC